VENAVGWVVALRRVLGAVNDPSERRRLAKVIRQLRAELGAGIPKHRAAACLGVSAQGLDRWVRAGAIPVVRKLGSSRELIDREALLAIVEEVDRLREAGRRRPLASALRTVANDGRVSRRLRPNQSARELRREYLDTTSAQRLRTAIELSHTASALAASARACKSPDTVPHFYDLLRALGERDIDFVLIGGFAVTLHGYVRTTKDIDIVPDREEASMSRLWDVLDELEARPGEIDGGWNWPLYTTLGRLDLMTYVEDADGELTYAELRESAERVELEEVGHPIWIASVDHLIAMKEHAGRDIDRIDLTAMRMAQGLEDD